MRHIFSKLIDETIKRDELYRKELNETVKKSVQRTNAPTSIQLPTAAVAGWQENVGSAVTPRANGNSFPMTPGMGIGVATPGPVAHLPGVPEDGAPLDKRASQASRHSADKSGDYFSSTPTDTGSKTAGTPGERHDDKTPKSPTDGEKDSNGKDSNNLFGKKFRMSFGSKKLGRSASSNIEKPVVVDEKAEDGSETSENGEKEKDKEVDDSFLGVVQRVRNDYEKALLDNPDQQVESGITPSLPNETPVLKLPPMTTVIIQEETSGGSADLYRGTVATVGEDASLIEAHAPMWLGELLLKVCKFL